MGARIVTSGMVPTVLVERDKTTVNLLLQRWTALVNLFQKPVRPTVSQGFSRSRLLLQTEALTVNTKIKRVSPVELVKTHVRHLIRQR